MSWPLAELCTRLAVRPVELGALRREFAQVVRLELPRHRSESIAALLRSQASLTQVPPSGS
ncbi:hypothetical protein [Micromonospora sp. NPDC002717]|uniref:hypothetical protein n=1 Tax=Micromonospora sp. NPDC002717 TaxID=3154424 RepID=UPI003323601A